MCIHTEYGPWFALRAVVLFPDSPETLQTITKPVEIQLSKDGNLFQDESKLETDSGNVTSKLPMLNFQEIKKKMQKFLDSKDPESKYQLLLEVRDEAGKFEPAFNWRYSKSQMDYHYLKDVSILQESIKHL